MSDPSKPEAAGVTLAAPSPDLAALRGAPDNGRVIPYTGKDAPFVGLHLGCTYDAPHRHATLPPGAPPTAKPDAARLDVRESEAQEFANRAALLLRNATGPDEGITAAALVSIALSLAAPTATEPARKPLGTHVEMRALEYPAVGWEPVMVDDAAPTAADLLANVREDTRS